MISNERSWPHLRKFNRPMNHHAAPYRTPAPRPFVQEEQLKSEVIQIERKQFVVTLKENPRGRFLRISEESSNRRNTIIIPATGLADFQKLLEEMVIADSETPPPAPSPEM